MPAVRVYLASHLSAYQPDKPASVRELIEPLVQQLYYQPRSTSLWERTKARWINELPLRQAAAQLTQVLQQQLTAQVARVDTVLSGPDFHGQAGSQLAKLGSDVAVKLTTDMARQIDFTVLDKSLPQVFADAVILQFNTVSNSGRSMVLMMLAALLLLVAAEIVIYRRYFKPAAMPAPLPAPAMVIYALCRSRLDPHCSPSAFAWTYTASLFVLSGLAWCCYTYNIKPGNSVSLLLPMVVLLWCGSFTLCLAVRHRLLRSRPHT